MTPPDILNLAPPISPRKHPIVCAPETMMLPSWYVVYKRTQLCRHCQTRHEFSECYAVNLIRTRTGEGKPVINMVPLSEFRYNIPIKVECLAPIETPACHECAPQSIDLSSLPRIEETDEWSAMVEARKAILKAQEKPKAKREAQKPVSLDDAMNLI